MKKYSLLILLVFFCSCKSKKVVSDVKVNDSMSTNKIIENIYNNKKDFSTLYIKSDVRYESEKQTQNVSAEIRIKKDEMILVSIRFLGITMAKALITPTEVQYYEKMGSTYFKGDYSSLSKWLGTDLDFQKVQNLLIGQALDDLKKGKYTSIVEDNLYKLATNSDVNTNEFVFAEATRFLITKQEISQQSQDRFLRVSYPDYSQINQIMLPSKIILEAFQKEAKTNITVDYNSVTVNEDLNFPYKVPNGYDQININ